MVGGDLQSCGRLVEIHRACQPARGTDGGHQGPHRPERAAAEILIHDICRLDGALAGVEILACYSKHGIFSHTAKVAKVLVGGDAAPSQDPHDIRTARTPDMN
jgi:hypothetical protein